MNGFGHPSDKLSCYFLLNFGCVEWVGVARYEHIPCYFLLNFGRTTWRCTASRQRHNSSCYFLLNFGFSEEAERKGERPSPPCLLFSFEFWFRQPASGKAKQHNLIFSKLAIFFWILACPGMALSPGTGVPRTCYFLLNFGYTKASVKPSPRPSYALLFSFEFWVRALLYAKLYNATAILLFSFEFWVYCSVDQHQHSLVLNLLFSFEFWPLFEERQQDLLQILRLAIFFWILAIWNNFFFSICFEAKPCYFLLNFGRYPSTFGRGWSQSWLAIFFWILAAATATVHTLVYAGSLDLLFSFEFWVVTATPTKRCQY